MWTDDDATAFFDAVVAGGEQRRHAGPARLHAAAWDRRRDEIIAAAGSAQELAAVMRACRQGFVLTHEQARVAGIDRARIRRLLARERWSAPHRGVLSPLPPEHGNSPVIRATAAGLVRPRTVISQESALAVWGLPRLREPARPSLTGDWAQAGCNWPEIRVLVAALPPEDVTTWFGAKITTIARTVVDESRHSVRRGLVAADSAVRDQLITVADLEAVIERHHGWPGVETARLVAGLAHEWSESPLESLSRLFLHNNAIPLPQPQQWVQASGKWYRVDGLWDDRAVVLEVDGMVKYRRPHDASKGDPLVEEKLRELALERAGYLVVRVTWADIHERPALTVRRILDALRRGGPRLHLAA